MEKDISKINLTRHSIYYDPKVHQGNDANPQSTADSLPDHVDAVRAGLLCMQKIIPEDCWDATLQKELSQYGSADIGPEWCLHPPESAKHHGRLRQQSPLRDNLEFCKSVVEVADRIQDDSEDEWTLFWRTKIFRLFSDDRLLDSGFDSSADAWSLYENVQWNEFDSFAKSCPWLPPRTHPKPDLTYAFPIQISPPGSLQGFAKDELTQTLSVQSLGKLVEQGVTCAPTTALRNKANHSDGSGWSSSDRSCFPWAVVEIKKDVASPRDAAIERCYCQAANAAAAALEIQAQLFKKINDILPLQSPPVVAFTCVGPVVKVWLAYNDKPEFGHPVQRMRCIWSTSIRLTWGVVSLRAIVKNMHTWSSRLLKPKLQVAILQASKRLPTKSPPGFHDPPNWCLPTPVVHCSEAVSTNSSSKKNPGISQMFGNSITPEKHNAPVLHLRIDTPTPSKNTDHTSPLRNCQPEAALGARNDSFFGNNNKSAAAGPSTTRTHGLFGQNAGPSTTRTHGLFGQNAPDVFIGPGFDWSLHTATSIGLRSQSATKSGSNLFGGTSTSVARDPGKNTFDADVGSNYVKGGLFGATIGHSATKVNHGERRPSISLAPPDSDGRPVSSTGGVSAWGSPRKPGAVSLSKSESSSSSKPRFGSSSTSGFGSSSTSGFGSSSTLLGSSSTSGFGTSSKSEFGSSSTLGFGSSSPIPRSSRFGLSSEPALSSSSKSDCARVDTCKNNDRGGSSSGSSRSNISAPMHTHRKSSVRAARQTDVCDITTAFASTSLGFTSTHHTTLNGATGPGHRHLDKAPNKPKKTPNYDTIRRRAK